MCREVATVQETGSIGLRAGRGRDNAKDARARRQDAHDRVPAGTGGPAAAAESSPRTDGVPRLRTHGDLTISSETHAIGPGDSWCIPGDVEHSAAARADSDAIEVFCPVREDYLSTTG